MPLEGPALPGKARRGGLSVAILGTRGLPARYGGFETFAEELATRLVADGWSMIVYGRHDPGRRAENREYRGVQLRSLPVRRSKYFETVLHTLRSAWDLRRRKVDAVLLCNTANALAIPLIQRAGIPVLVNVDGLEWRRRKWGPLGRAWHRGGAALAARWGAGLVADSRFIQRYWTERFGRTPAFVAYGAPQAPVAKIDALREHGLESRGYVLYVARLEPENNPCKVARAYAHVPTESPLVMLGDATYAPRIAHELRELASRDSRLRLLGGLYGAAYAQLQSHAVAYVQASEVGGTHPALLEAMGYGGVVLANDIPEHREVLGDAGRYYVYNDERSLAGELQRLLEDPAARRSLRGRAGARVREHYCWDLVASQYGQLLAELGRATPGALR